MRLNMENLFRKIKRILLALGLCFSFIDAQSFININQASAEELETLHGVGFKKAKAIVDYRSAHGKFRTTREIIKVKGIGEAIWKKNRDQMTVESNNRVFSIGPSSYADEKANRPRAHRYKRERAKPIFPASSY